MLLTEWIFWLSLLALVHSYVLYPLLLRLLYGAREGSPVAELQIWPEVTLLMSVYNEELVIETKMRSLQALDYPAERLHCFIGSDDSSDRTNDILAAYAAENPQIHFFPFTQRRGKPGVINELAERALQARGRKPDHIFLLTDANVILRPDTLKKLVRHFSRPEIAVVDAHMMHTGIQREGISRSEHQYISREVELKHLEGQLWGSMIGPFGGCYTLRSTYWTPVPPTFLVDDFYITMRALEQGGKAINDLDARCTETVTHDLWVEFRRKSRISAGNFQNLFTFKHLLWPPWTGLAFSFFSHKILRWLGPFFFILMLGCSLGLSFSNTFYKWLFIIQLSGWLGLPLLDFLLQRSGRHWLLLRSLNYFIIMNAALFYGFIKYLKGIKSNVWERTKRSSVHQAEHH